MYQRYQPTKDSYDMIYGGSQSMGVPLNHPFQLGFFHENHPAIGVAGSPMEPPAMKTCLGSAERSGWIHWILQVGFGALDLDLQVGFVEPFQDPWVDTKRRGKAMVSITITQSSC